jgi:hypothetical protein
MKPIIEIYPDDIRLVVMERTERNCFIQLVKEFKAFNQLFFGIDYAIHLKIWEGDFHLKIWEGDFHDPD